LSGNEQREDTLMAVVLFNSVDEFLGELGAEIDGDYIERRIVRLVCQTRRSRDGATVMVSIIATAVAHGQILRLERYAGDYLDINSDENDHARRVQAHADQIVAAIEAKARELGLEIRPGLLLSAERQP
jgi:hypothetical protein